MPSFSNLNRRLAIVELALNALPDPRVYEVNSMGDVAKLQYLYETAQRPEVVKFTEAMQEVMARVASLSDRDWEITEWP